MGSTFPPSCKARICKYEDTVNQVIRMQSESSAFPFLTCTNGSYTAEQQNQAHISYRYPSNISQPQLIDKSASSNMVSTYVGASCSKR